MAASLKLEPDSVKDTVRFPVAKIHKQSYKN
jgi:hypothetical protein